MMSSQNAVVHPAQHLKISRNSDGTITRLRDDPHVAASAEPDPTLPIPVLTKDVPINQSNNTSARIFLPRQPLHPSTSYQTKTKLPLIVFFHGGGFILFSAKTTFIHDFCVNLANDVASIVVSVDYRLAPEHRLPAAYEDAVEALHWIKTSSDEWLKNHADFSNCYLMGSSSGANIAYNAGLRAAAEICRDNNYLGAVKIRGMILVQPFFGGAQRVASELRLANDPVLPPGASDLMWELALPVGVDRDHEYCNPTAGDGPRILERVGWRVLVSGCDGDPVVDHQRGVARLMEEKGVRVVSRFVAGDWHGVELRDPIKRNQLFMLLTHFITSSPP